MDVQSNKTLDLLHQNSKLPSKSEWHSPQVIDNYLSLYNDEKPDRGDFIQANNRLGIAFPKMTKEFFVLLTEFLITENFTKQRLKDAVNYVIKNFPYKELNISDIISYDRKVKLYTHSEASALVTQGKASFEDFEKREIDGKIFRILKSDTIY